MREGAAGPGVGNGRILYAADRRPDPLTLTGGAISKETQLFLSTVLAPMMQGA